ncbi:MAG: transglycosylase SLT domain-containing protein [Deltaproteobacteria bacterium]|nr:transglycosylase SLT domain-containing protein [Deltaproteobacteria bacterium]
MMKSPKKLVVFFLLPLLLVGTGAAACEDPWIRLQRNVEGKKAKPEEFYRSPGNNDATDPWNRLRKVFIPLEYPGPTTTDFKTGAKRSDHNKNSAILIEKKLAPWRKSIAQAAQTFNVPPAVIKAVIIMESGGNPHARADSSSAAGLMQTIKATFADAHRALSNRGLVLVNDPLDPHASIMAGSWYLGEMFNEAERDGKPEVGPRTELLSWRYALEYYYAGPAHGRKPYPRVLIYRNGKSLLIDKKAYSDKVLEWAATLV